MKTIVRSIVFALCVITGLSGCGGWQKTVPLLTIAPTSLPNGTFGVPYSQTIQAGGGVAPFTWTVIGTLPHNLQLVPSASNTAEISGTPDTAAQAIAFSIEVKDSSNQSATEPYTLSILALPDALSFSPATGLSFSPQLVGTASTTLTGTLANSGTSPVVINSVATGGDFSQSNTCHSSLAAGANCTITVTFTPSHPGPSGSTITVTDDTVGSPHHLSLSGIGLTSGPNATLSTTSLFFGSVVIGKPSGPLSITLTNYGTASLNILSVLANADFGESDDCSATSLAPAANCTINVTLTATTLGTLTGTLSVADNAPSSPQTAFLGGTGVTGGCIPLGGQCYEPVNRHSCCPAPFPHHTFCAPSGSNGWGYCTEN